MSAPPQIIRWLNSACNFIGTRKAKAVEEAVGVPWFFFTFFLSLYKSRTSALNSLYTRLLFLLLLISSMGLGGNGLGDLMYIEITGPRKDTY